MTEAFSRVLAGFVTGYRTDDVPPAAITAAKMCVADAIAAACSSASRPSGAKALQMLAPGAGSGSRSGIHRVIGSGGRYDAESAAFANAVLMHAEDFDDTPHTCYYLPALLAAAEETGASGSDLVASWTVAYEVWMALVQGLRMDRPFNPTSVVAPIAAAAGVSWLKGLDMDATTAALAIATQASGGIRGHFGTDMKALDAGRSAKAGLNAVMLAERGWTAEEEIFESANGWAAAFGGRDWSLDRARESLSVPSEAFPRLGRPPGAKDWPCCARHIGPLTALFALASEREHMCDVIAIHLETGFDPGTTAAFRDWPANGLEGKFSVRYVAAAAWLDGRVVPESFDQPAYERISSDPLYANITVSFNPDRAGSQSEETCLVRLVLSDGSERVREQRGVPFLSAGEVMEKLRRNAARLLGEESAGKVRDVLGELESEGEAAAVLALLAHRAEHQPAL